MKKIKINRVPKRHNFLKASGTALLALIMLMNAVGAEPSSNITFVTTGSSFSPIITVTGNCTIQWTFGDGTTSNSAAPRKNFGSVGTRTNTLVVTPWSAVTKINIGYDGSDDGVPPSSSTIARLNQQNVIAVTGLENVAPFLQIWASSKNPITELDFNNFVALHTIECFYCTSLDSIKLRNVPSLNRLCLEHCNISYLGLSEAPALADIRASSQQSSTYTINWGTTGANIWHICIRDNPQITSTFPFNQFPILKDFYNWNDNQSGTLHLTSTSLRRVLSSNNHYSAAVLSGCFPAGRSCELNIHDNNLKSLDISNDPGLLYLDASRNSLNQTAVDGVLQTLDSYNTGSGTLDLTGNAAPSIAGIAHANNLTARNWEIKIPSQNNPPIANFTSNVTSGKVPLAVQFNDTSSGNPTSRSWEFGDGTYSTEKSPEHVYTSPGNYRVTLAVRNSNSADFKDVMITVLNEDSSSGDSGNGGSSGSGGSHSGGGGSAGGSPEPQSNVEVKELSQAFVNNGKSVRFDFPRNATPVVYVSFDSKKTAGKTTTIVETLKGKSTLVSDLPTDEVYKSLNIWVGNAGFATPNNIGNAVVYFKVEKSWIQDKNIDKFSIVLNRYTDKKWAPLPTSLSDEDGKYIYFTAKTPGFSPFAITGKNTSTVTEIEPTTANVGKTPEQTASSNSSRKGDTTKIPGFEVIYEVIGLLALFLHKRK